MLVAVAGDASTLLSNVARHGGRPLTQVPASAHDATASMGLPLVCRPRTTAALLVFAVTARLGAPAVAAAELDPVALLWNAPVGCSTAEAVEEQVEKGLGTTVDVVGRLLRLPARPLAEVIEAS